MGTPLCSGNQGVIALGTSLARLCINAAPNTTVQILGSSRTAHNVTLRPNGSPVSIPQVHWRLSTKSSPRDHLAVILLMSLIYRCLPLHGLREAIARSIPWIRAVRELDLVGDVRGGDSFSDIYGLKRFLLASLPVVSVILVKKSFVSFPQTYGPFRTRTARLVARFLLKRSSVVIARDTESQRIAQELVGSRLKVQLSPDVAFALYSDTGCKIEIDAQQQAKVPPQCIGLNVNGLMFNGGYTGRNMFGLKTDYRKLLPLLVSRLLEVHQGAILLVPHTFAPTGNPESDNDACRQLLEMLPAEARTRVHMLTGTYDAHQLKGIIRSCDFFIGSRMHSCIAALSQGVPCVGVAYSMKFKGVFESVGMAEWVVDCRDFTEGEAVDRIVALYQSRNQVRAELSSHADAARRRLDDVFRNLINPASKKSAAVSAGELLAESAVP